MEVRLDAPFNKYSVTDRGCVISYVKKRRKLKSHVGDNGYQQITLKDANGFAKKFYIHRLVAEKFIPNLQNMKYVKHIDGNRSNNTINNLYWSDIMHDKEVSASDLENVQVTCMETDKVYPSIRECAKQYNVSQTAIRYACELGRALKSSGHHFMYLNKSE